jgi:hypothetical protein
MVRANLTNSDSRIKSLSFDPTCKKILGKKVGWESIRVNTLDYPYNFE